MWVGVIFRQEKPIPQHYHYGLVLVSLLVAILASYTALTLALHIRGAARATAPAWLVGGGFAMGLGIWCMHFVGMLALSLPIDIAYHFGITVLSLVIAIVVSTLQALTKPPPMAHLLRLVSEAGGAA